MKRVLITLLSLGLAGCGEDIPDRNLIPVIKERLFVLQEAVQRQDLGALDSLITDQAEQRNCGGDSLIRFVTGSHGFIRFGNCEIMYTQSRARADCFLVDAAGQDGRQITMTFARSGDRWLLDRFEPARPDTTAE